MTDEQPTDEFSTPPVPDASATGPDGSEAPAAVRAVTGEVVDSTSIPRGHLELVEEGARDVTVESLTVRQGGVNNARAETIDVRQGGITRAEGRDISVTQGGIAIARADRVSVGMGAVGLAVAADVDVRRGFARTVIARDVRIEQAGARTVIANTATFDKTSGALVVIAAKAEGNVRTLLDWRGALAFGAAFGIVVGLVRRVRR
jgi:hypothetical protein